MCKTNLPDINEGLTVLKDCKICEGEGWVDECNRQVPFSRAKGAGEPCICNSLYNTNREGNYEGIKQ